MDSDKTVTANFSSITKLFNLTVTAANGSVTRNPDKSSYACGETVTLISAPDSCYNFTGWSGDVSGSSTSTTVTMTSDKTVTANFSKKTYTLTTNASSGSITKSPDKSSYTCGEAVILTAVPNSCYGFTGWSGDASGTSVSTTITMNSNKSVTAGFSGLTHTLTTSASNGSVTISPDKFSYTCGETVSLTATPDSCYNFTGWSGDAAGSSAATTITMTSDKSVTANFSSITRTFALNVTASNGSITISPDKASYACGETVTLSATPDFCYKFTGWSGDTSGSSASTTITMTSDRSVTANFSNLYTLTTTASNGSITKSPDKSSYTCGETVTLTAVPDTGYEFTGWSGDTSGSNSTTTITMDSDRTVTANFIGKPIAVFFMTNATGVEPLTVGLDASGSTDIDGTIVSYDWSILDDTGTATHSAAGKTASVTLPQGTYSVELTLTDNDGNVTVSTTPSAASAYSKTSEKTFSSSGGQTTTHLFSGTPPSAAVSKDGTLTVEMKGDYGSSSEYAEIYMDGTYIGKHTGGGNECKSFYDAVSFTIPKADLQTYVSDGKINVEIKNTSWVDFCSGSHKVQLTITASSSASNVITVTPTFHSLTVTVSPATSGTVSLSPDKPSYCLGETVTLDAATADPCYNFTGWSGDTSGSNASIIITMDSDKTVTASFSKKTYTLTTNASNGSITISPDKASYTCGETVTLTAAPDSCYTFTGWSGDASGSSASTTITMDSTRTVTANFSSVTKPFNLTVAAANGSVTRNPDKASYTCGETVTLTAAPDSCYTFTGWSGDASGAGATTTITMDSDKTVTAGFSKKTYTLTTTASNGSITKSPDKSSYTCGETVTLTVVPDTGYEFTGWSGDASGSNSTTTITMDSDRTVTANFIGKPVAVFFMTNVTGMEPLTVGLDASGSTDIDGTIVSYDWSILDDTGTATHSAAGKTASVTLPQGTYSVELTLTDNDGNVTVSTTPSAASAYSKTSEKTFSSSGGQTTTHLFSGTPASAAVSKDGTLKVEMKGDYGLSSEYAEIYMDGTYIGKHTGGGNECESFYDAVTFTIPRADLQTYVSDGKINVEIKNTSEVGYCPGSHKVQLTIDVAGSASPMLSQLRQPLIPLLSLFLPQPAERYPSRRIRQHMILEKPSPLMPQRLIPVIILPGGQGIRQDQTHPPPSPWTVTKLLRQVSAKKHTH